MEGVLMSDVDEELPLELWWFIFVGYSDGTGGHIEEMIPIVRLVSRAWNDLMRLMMEISRESPTAIGDQDADAAPDSTATQTDSTVTQTDSTTMVGARNSATASSDARGSFRLPKLTGIHLSIALARKKMWPLLLWTVKQAGAGQSPASGANPRSSVWDARVLEAAINSGCTETATQVLNGGCPWKEETTDAGRSKGEARVLCAAAAVGNLPLLQLLSSEIPCHRWDNLEGISGEAAIKAAENGHLHILQWMAAQKSAMNEHLLFIGAIQCGHLRVAKWAYERRGKEDASEYYRAWMVLGDSDGFIKTALDNPDVPMLRWFQSLNVFALSRSFRTPRQCDAWFTKSKRIPSAAVIAWLSCEFRPLSIEEPIMGREVWVHAMWAKGLIGLNDDSSEEDDGDNWEDTDSIEGEDEKDADNDIIMRG